MSGRSWRSSPTLAPDSPLRDARASRVNPVAKPHRLSYHPPKPDIPAAAACATFPRQIWRLLMRTIVRNVVIVVASLVPFVALAQSGSTKPATYITKEEVEIVNKQPGGDRQIR